MRQSDAAADVSSSRARRRVQFRHSAAGTTVARMLRSIMCSPVSQKVRVNTRDRVGRHGHVEMADIGVQCDIEDALFG